MTRQAEILYTTINDATLGCGKIKLNDPTITFEFGRYNARPIDTTKLKGLRKSLEAEGQMWYRPETWLPLIIPDASWVDANTLTKDFTKGSMMPILALTTEGQQRMASWVMASGQHRVEAVRQILADKGKELQLLRTEQHKTNEQNIDEGRKKAINARLEEQIRTKLADINDLQWWGVIVYDEGESIQVHV